MDLQDQVCSLEQAKRLEELLGENQPSQFFWAISRYQGQETIELAMPHVKGMYVPDMMGPGEGGTSNYDEGFPAYTPAELGAILPVWYTTERYDTGEYYCGHSEDFEMTMLPGRTMAEAMAGQLITLLSQGEVSADEVNTRLKA